MEEDKTYSLLKKAAETIKALDESSRITVVKRKCDIYFLVIDEDEVPVVAVDKDQKMWALIGSEPLELEEDSNN